MTTYNLDEDEVVIMQDANVTDQTNHTVTVVLTNKSILNIDHSLWGSKNSYRLPLSDLKESNGNPNVLIGKSPDGKSRLELFFSDAHQYFSFKGLMAEKKWASAVVKAYKARMKELAKSEREPLDAATLFAPILGKLDATKNAIMGAKNVPKAITNKCPFCGAVTTGYKGDEVTCSYCESKFILK